MSVSATSSSTTAAQSSSSTSGSGSSSLSSVDFLQLLIAQLTHQDPLNPTEDLDFTAQLAQLQALDQQMTMTETMTAMRLDTQVQSGTNMIGKEITGTDKYGSDASGTVVRVVQSSSEVYVELANGQQVPVSNVTNITSNDTTGLADEMSNSANVIGMWVEAGYDSAFQPIKGIVEKITTSGGSVYLELYGGQKVTWDQVTLMRAPTEDESWYVLPDSVRENVEKAQAMIGLTVTGQDTSGNKATGIVAQAQLENSTVYLYLFDGTKIDVENVSGEASMPTAEDAVRDLAGFYAVGYDEQSKSVEGVIVGAEDRDDGLALILSDGSAVYYDALTEIREATEDELAAVAGGGGDDTDYAGIDDAEETDETEYADAGGTVDAEDADNAEVA